VALERQGARSSGLYPDLTNPVGQAEFMRYVIEEINVLNQIVVDLATEIDRLNGI
jgi:hypothetical protein